MPAIFTTPPALFRVFYILKVKFWNPLPKFVTCYSFFGKSILIASSKGRDFRLNFTGQFRAYAQELISNKRNSPFSKIATLSLGKCGFQQAYKISPMVMDALMLQSLLYGRGGMLHSRQRAGQRSSVGALTTGAVALQTWSSAIRALCGYDRINGTTPNRFHTHNLHRMS